MNRQTEGAKFSVAQAPGERRIDALKNSDFDSDAWMALIAEQRLRIANAAGVDPSKVSIRLGH